ncbi:hypothetical protein [Neolewinella litorea]|uniref:Uncharacterized protein n=1 Tax=Neolewinella litorea TaxID=2562452 RepID=A0A4S4NAL3_9BACT|nr:hypothetical protein [Neolewinella litorea]THH36386.1 hypothetical protein E4021_14975 [Neolewinella litorea]
MVNQNICYFDLKREMEKHPKYTITDKPFYTKTALQLAVRSKISGYSPGSYLQGKDFEFMTEYLRQCHIYWNYKSRSGVSKIEVVKNLKNPKTKGIILHLKCGEKEVVSYTLSKIEKRNYNQEFRDVMRYVVKPQIYEAKTKYFDGNEYMICSVTKEPFAFEDCDVDHIDPEFEEIVKSFIDKFKISITPGLFPDVKDFDGTYKLTDTKVTDLFYNYHKSVCNLQCVSKNGHKIITARRKK